MYGPSPVRKAAAPMMQMSGCVHVSGLSMERQGTPGHDGNPRVFSVSLQRPLRALNPSRFRKRRSDRFAIISQTTFATFGKFFPAAPIRRRRACGTLQRA
jgi:hypothetical protein